MVLNTEWAQVEVIELINDGSGLAFGIIGGRSTGVVVKTILPGGVADRDGRLQSGDHILQIGEVNLRGLGSEQVASVLRQCGIHVRMVVARPIESSSADYQALGSHAPIVPTKILGDPVELDRHLVENGYAETSTYHPPSSFSTPFIYTNNSQPSSFQMHPICGAVDVVKNPLPIGDVPPPPVNNNNTLPETEIYHVELTKDDLGLGITVAGYVCEREEISGIFVKSISPGSAADLTNQIKINDRIIEVDGVSVLGHTNHQAVELLRNSGSQVKIKFERYLRGPKYEQLQQAIRANELRPQSPQSPTISSLPKVPLSQVQTSFLGIETEGESRTSFDFDSAVLLEGPEDREIVIDCRQSIQFSISSQESICEKWRDKIPPEVEIIIAEMQKESNSGLGISLEGTVDVEGGKEVRPHHYIRNILSDGPVGRNGVLQAGDELLEVNGIQLMGLNHLEVVSILKQLPNFVSLVCARNPISSRVIDTSQHRDAFRARKILAGSLQTLIPVSENASSKMVKAKSETSIASSFNSDCNGSNKSRSLELIAGLPMWSEEVTTVELAKGDFGLGFSILDYQDPLSPQETVIVIRSLVPGGVAQQNGRLIPGDRLLSVNGVDVSHATLDEAVQVLKGTPKGRVRIGVAKPLSASHDANSHGSQFVRKVLRQWSEELEYVVLSDTEEDQTCLEEDFQECIEEYQECLEVVHICIDEENSSVANHSPSSNSLLTTIKRRDESDLDLSFKSTNKTDYANDRLESRTQTQMNTVNVQFINKTSDSLTQSDKDGYETCIDESISEDAPKLCARFEEIVEDVTPTNSKSNISASSDPCLLDDDNDFNTNYICLDSKPSDDDDEILKSYDNRVCDESDEFFLVQYPPGGDVVKSYSDPNVLEAPISKRLTYRLEEYYNDYEDCLEAYRIKEEMKDEEIFNEILVPFKHRSAPDIMDRSFVTMTYDPGPACYLRRKSAIVGYNNNDISSGMTVIRPEGDLVKHQRDAVSEMLQKHWGAAHDVKVFRQPGASLGISIVGGKVDLSKAPACEKLLGIFVKTVVPDSPAGLTGQFKTGDRILEVSGVDLTDASHEKAVEAIRNASNPVVFVVQSLLPWTCDNDGDTFKTDDNNCPSPFPSPVSVHAPKESEVPQISVSSNDNDKDGQSLKLIVSNNLDDVKLNVDVPKPVEIQISGKVASPEESDEEDEDDDEEDDTRDLEGRTISSKGQQIDRASAGNLRRSREEIEFDPEAEDDFGYTSNKVKKKYASLGHTILMVQLERSKQGLGLSLAGHKDRNCMAVFVCGLNPNGAAYKTGGIQIGDEILEVNGVVLHGRCHLNASAIIKGLSGPIFKVIILRRKTAIDDIAVKPITQFPVSLAEEASEEQFTNSYPNVRTVAVKKGNQSLGIMIIEGKHAEVGQGIFISDIQEGSAAEKAGLEIGEMILAVNKDSLVGSNYDQAASLLKRTEGLVTLVVSNPSKKDHRGHQEQNQQVAALTQHHHNQHTLTVENNKNAGGLKASGPPSRPTTPIPDPGADPAICQILPGKDTTIEIVTDNRGLGVFFVGGKDTLIPNGIVVIEIYPGGAADKDNRLKPGDQILDVNGAALKDVSSTTASQALRQTLPKMKMIVFRPDKLEYTKLEIDLLKKPGKGLGLSVIAKKSGKGVYIADIINGGTADLDGRIMRGDLLVSVNGQSVENCSGEEAGAILKTVMGKVSLKLHRYKPVAR